MILYLREGFFSLSLQIIIYSLNSNLYYHGGLGVFGEVFSNSFYILYILYIYLFKLNNISPNTPNTFKTLYTALVFGELYVTKRSLRLK